jgi:eukaryotic-like serine/threonine-protein kinase
MSFERQPGDAGAAAPPPEQRFQLADRLDEGAIFIVYAGRDQATGRTVALSRLRPEYARDSLFTGLLRSETRKAQRVQHPGIITVIDVWGEGDAFTVATEPLRGVHLKERIRRVAPFPLAVAVDIAAACAEALASAAQAGIVHGDLRPENILITPEGAVKVGGFGVGAGLAASSRIQLTALPELAPYLAPERAQGAEPDTRADVYSLGIILYEMLGAVTPFIGETPLAVAVKHLHDPPPPLRKHCPGVPPAVEGVILKCLQKDPAARYASMADLLRDLNAIREALTLGRPLDGQPALPQAAAAPAAATRSSGAAAPVAAAAAAQPAARAAPPPLPAASEATEPSFRLLALGCAGVLLTILIAFLIPTIFLRPTAEVQVPNVLGKQRATAVHQVEQVRLTPKVVEQFNEKVPPGVVFLQEPEAGLNAKQDNLVRIFVSKGPQPATVPDVVGKQLKVAQDLVRDAQLNPGVVHEEFNDTVAKGEVIAQEPAPGTAVTRHSTVALTVSKGQEPEQQPKQVEIGPSNGENGSPPAEDQPSRQFKVTVRVPRLPDQPQTVRIVVRDEDGNEHEEYNQDHEPGEEISPVVRGVGGKEKITLRVWVNNRRVAEQKF